MFQASPHFFLGLHPCTSPYMSLPELGPRARLCWCRRGVFRARSVDGGGAPFPPDVRRRRRAPLRARSSPRVAARPPRRRRLVHWAPRPLRRRRRTGLRRLHRHPPVRSMWLDYIVITFVRRGRPRTAWMDNTKTWTELSVEESVRVSEDRDKWRKYVRGVANPRIEDG